MKVKVKDIKPNPNNPRYIRDEKFEKLKQSIKEFPEMLKLRPVVVDDNMMVLGGNMRLKALTDLGIEEVEIIKAKDLTDKQKEEFIIKDNVGFGEWDWDMLANEQDNELLTDWGLDVVKYDWDDLDYIDEDIDKPELKSNNKIEVLIPSELIDEIDNIKDSLQQYLSENFSGCEVQ